MAKLFRLNEVHLFERLGKKILFDIHSMAVYEAAPLTFDIITVLSDPAQRDPIKALSKNYRKAHIRKALAFLEEQKIIRKADEPLPPKPVLKKRRGMRHLELMVTHGCNMGCRYCYGAHGLEGWDRTTGLYGTDSSGMSLETALKGVDFLCNNSGAQTDLSLTFFGGEPLLEFRLIEQIVPYVREQEKKSNKKISLSLSTNGLLLSEPVVDFLAKNRISCQISIDGPPEIHNFSRCLPDGTGSYEKIIEGVKRLIKIRPGKVPARATLFHGTMNMAETAKHILSLGFGSVHMEPATGRSSGDLEILPEDLPAIKRQNEELAVFLVDCVKKNRYFNYTNLVKFIRQTRVVRERSAHYCGAGRTYFAMSQDGGFYPCHRFVGMDDFRMGDIHGGMELGLQEKILGLTVDNRPVCKDCWARYLCGGGCWRPAVDRYGSLERPDEEVGCEITKHQIECAMAVNTELSVDDKDILSNMYEESEEKHLIAQKGA